MAAPFLLLLAGGGAGATVVTGTGTGAIGTSGSATGTISLPTETPVPFVEAAFGYGALTDPADAVWTDISAYVLNVSIKRGRQTELDAFSPGTCTVVLDNSDRRFDPEHSSGPYYGNLVANVPIRVTATETGVSYPRFYGFVNEWPQTYAPPKWATVQVTATDAFKLFAGMRLPQSVYIADLQADSPVALIPFGDTNSTDAAELAAGVTGVFNDASSTGAAVVAGGGASTNIASGSFAVRFPESLIPSDGPFCITLGVRTSSTGRIFQILTSNVYIDFGIDSRGVMYLTYSYPAVGGLGPFYAYNPTQGSRTRVINDGKPHLIYINLIAGLKPGLVLQPSISIDGGALMTLAEVDTSPAITPSYVRGLSFGGTTGECDVSSFALFALDDSSHGNVFNNYPDFFAPWFGDNTGTRVGRVLDAISWPTGQRSLDTGEYLLNDATLAGRAPLDYLQQVEATEQGRFFIDKSGKVVFHSRDHDLTNTRGTTAQAIFSDDGDDIAYEPNGFELTRDDRYVYREVTGSLEGGSTLAVRDSTLPATDPVQTKSLTNLMVRTEAEVRNVIESFLLRYKTSRTRPSGWTVMPLSTASTWETVLSLEIGDRVTLQATPQSIGSQYSDDFHIESITEDWQPGPTAGATFSFTASPVDHNSYFRWDSSLLDGTDVLR